MKALTDINRLVDEFRLLRECQIRHAQLRREAKKCKHGYTKAVPKDLIRQLRESRDYMLRIRRNVDAMLGIEP